MLSSDQVRYLRERPWGGAFRVDPSVAQGNVYVPGEYIVGQLNRAFGFDGWSWRIVETLRCEAELVSREGKDQWRLVVAVRGELRVRTPGGVEIVREGFGSDEAVSRNQKDVWHKAPTAASTHALKAAAITFGPQFGLTVVRAGKDQKGRKVDWTTRCQATHPTPPALYGAAASAAAPATAAQPGEEADGDEETPIDVDGQQFDPRTGVAVEPAPTQQRPEPAAQPAPAPQPAAQAQVARAEPQPAPAQAPAPKPAGDTDRRVELLAEARREFRRIQAGTGSAEAAQAAYAATAKAHSVLAPMAELNAQPLTFVQAVVAALKAVPA